MTEQPSLGGRSDQKAPALFSRPALIAFAVLTAAAAYTGRTGLVLLGGAFLSLALLARLWSRLSLWRLDYSQRLSLNRAFPGDRIALGQELSNDKPIPLAWIEVNQPVPVGLDPALEAAANPRPGRDGQAKPGLIASTSLLWYRRARWETGIACRRRGVYSFGPVKVASGDGFGLFPRSRVYDHREELIVYPALVELDELGLASRSPLGDASTSPPFEDPIRVRGLRDYTPDTPLKRIHWKASARRQSLQVKVFEPTTDWQVLVVLAVDGFTRPLVETESGWRIPAEENPPFERAVSLAASFSAQVIRTGCQCGCLVNGPQTGKEDRPVDLGPGSGPDHLGRILESLARVQDRPVVAFDQFFQSRTRALPWGTSLVVIGGGDPPEAVLVRLAELRDRGCPIQTHWLGNSSDREDRP